MLLFPEFPAICDSCGHQVPYERIDGPVYEVLLDAHYYPRFVDELRMLNKVADFYQRNPQVEGKIKPHWLRVMFSRNAKVRKQLTDNVPPAAIELPPEEQDEPIVPSDATDAAVIEYLRHHDFDLKARLRFVTEQLENTRYAVDRVPCSRCSKGRLRLVGDDMSLFR